MEPKPRQRPPLLEGPFDLAVVGGGINGAAIARDAALRGKSVLLVDKGDFGGGTSSATSKMAHGGIRYLEQLRFGLVHEALRERALLLRLAPHLVRPQAFLIPVYQGARRGPRVIRLGLFLYDLLAWGRRLGRSRFLDAAEARERAPLLRGEGLVGAGVYYDGVMNDARLCLANVIAALEDGRRLGVPVEARNYTELERWEPASPLRLFLRDRAAGGEGGGEMVVLAHRLVRALGPWTDPDLLVPSKGIHLVLPPLPTEDGLLLTHERDGRVFFVIPWLGNTVVGTTETPVNGALEEVRAEPEEVDYLLEELGRLVPGLSLSRGDILGTYAGVRPLARRRGVFGRDLLGAVSRRHRIVEDQGGVLTVFGGKYTTYRAVAKEVVDRLFPGSQCETARKALPGGECGPWLACKRLLAPEIARCGEAGAERLFWRYGTRMRDVLRRAGEDPALGERLCASSPELRAEAVHAAREELALYPEDFLARRTTLRFGPDGGRAAYDAVETLFREHAAAVPVDLATRRERYFEALAREEELRAEKAPTGTRSSP